LIVAVILVVLLLIGLLRLPAVQNAVKDQALRMLSDRYDAQWSIGDVSIDFFDEVLAHDILLLDQQGDTLLLADRLAIDIGLFSLLRREINLEEVTIDHLVSHIYTLDRETYNFSFLISEAVGSQSPTSSRSSWDISLGTVLLDIERVRYDSDSMRVALQQGSLEADVDVLDLSSKRLDLHKVDLRDLAIQATVVSAAPSSDDSEGFALPMSPWCVGSDQILLASIPASVVIDSTLHSVNLQNLNTSQVSYCGQKLTTNLDRLTASYNDEVALQEASLYLTIDSSAVLVDGLSARTANDRIKADRLSLDLRTNRLQSDKIDGHVSSGMLARLQDFLPDRIKLLPGANLDVKANSITRRRNSVRVKGLQASYADAIKIAGDATYREGAKPPTFDLSLTQLQVSLPRLRDLVPDLELPSVIDTLQMITVIGRVAGSLDAMVIREVKVTADDVVYIAADGTVAYGQETEILAYGLDSLTARVDVRHFPALAPEGLAWDSLAIVSYDGQVEGNSTDLSIDGTILTGVGKAIADMQLGNLDKEVGYRGAVELVGVDLGTLLRNDSLGRVSLNLDIDGRGSTLDSVQGSIAGAVSSIVYNGYDYQDISVDITGNQGRIAGQVLLDDDYVQLSYDGVVDLTGDQTTLDFALTLDTLALLPLGITDHDLRISGSVVSNIRLPMSTSDLSNLTINDLYMSEGERTFHEDSLHLAVATDGSRTDLTIDSDAMTLSASGDYYVQDIVADIERLLAYHMGVDTLALPPADHNISFTGQIRTLQFLDILLPTSSIQAGRIDIDLAADFAALSVVGSITADTMKAGAALLPKVALTLATEEDLIIDLKVEESRFGSIAVPLIQVDNRINRGTIDTDFLATDRDDLPKLKFYLQSMSNSDHWSVSLDDSLVVNTKDWTVNPSNALRWYEDYFTIDDLEMTDAREYMRLETVGDRGQDLELDFKNFEIGQFVTFLTGEESLWRGQLSGDIDVRAVQDDPYALVNVEVEDIVYDSTVVGNLTVEAGDNPATGVVTTALNLTGLTNAMQGDGTYDNKTGEVALNLDVASLEMRLLDPFLSEVIADSKGLLSGEVALSGSLEQPTITGEVVLDEVITTIVLTQARYAIDEQTITFDNESIDIGSVDLYDDQNQAAALSGKIYHDFLQDFYLDLQLDAEQFTFLNTTNADNPVFYGKLNLAAAGSIVGPVDLLQVDVKAKTLPTTAVTISPFSAEQYLLEEDFVAYGKPQDFEDKTSDYLLKLARAYPFKVNLLLDAADEAIVNFVIDPLSGDKIRAQGSGDLRIKLDPDGQQEIFGTYVVSDGAYSFSYGDFVNKDFGVRPGGTIRFNGDPLGAQLDIKAVYEVYTTTYELIKNEVVLDDSELSAAQDRTKVNVLLGLTGTLTAPEIDLDIEMPGLQSGNRITSIDRKLAALRSSPDELNNQVFGLLLFNSFVTTNSGASGFNTLGSNVALSSISNLISSQLNRLASDAIKGLDVSVDVNSYDSRYANDGVGGNVTEVGLQVSKQLFNDRLSLAAGGNVDIEGGDGASTYSNFIGDFVLEYRLTDDGRYRLRVFSKSDYDRLLNENTARNGVSIFFNKSFDAKVNDKQ
jgi:hypothetical protein